MHYQRDIWGNPEPSLQDKIQSGYKVIQETLNVYNPSHSFCLFSGGHDSLTATHLTMSFFDNHPEIARPSVVHIDTGIGIPETQDYVKMVCKKFGWDLKIYKAVENVKADGTPDPQIYEDLVKEIGFPGPYMHKKMYQRLKQRAILRLVREHKQFYSDKILLFSGIRFDESERRKQKVKKEGVLHKEGAQIWLKVIVDFTKDNSEAYMAQHSLPRNPVKDNLCMSGECLCGAFAEEGELEVIEFFYPETGKRIRDLEEEVRQCGFPWGWDKQPPKGWKHANKDAVDTEEHEEDRQMSLFDELMPLCHSCIAKKENME